MDILTFLNFICNCFAYNIVPFSIRNQFSKNQINNLQKFVVKEVDNQHVLSGRMDFLVTIIQLLPFLDRT